MADQHSTRVVPFAFPGDGKEAMKAFVVTGTDAIGDAHAIRFEEHAIAARRKGAAELGLAFTEVRCHRAPEMDDLAPGPALPSQLHQRGWVFECDECGEEIPGGGPPLITRGSSESWVFCSEICAAIWNANRVHRARREAAGIEATATRWPEATQITAYVSTDSIDMTFRLPGLVMPILWRIGRDELIVRACDMGNAVRLGYVLRRTGARRRDGTSAQAGE